MKQILFLCLLLAGSACSPDYKPSAAILKDYEGKYQMTIRGKTGAIQVSVKDSTLYTTALWSGEINKLKPVSPDNFIMQDKGWSVKFNRGKGGKVIQVLVMGTDLWTKTDK